MEATRTFSSLLGAVCPKAGTVARRRTHRAVAFRNQLLPIASSNGACRIANRDRDTVLLADGYFPIVSRVVPGHSSLLQPPCPGSEHGRVCWVASLNRKTR